MRQWHASATARFGCIAATSAHAYVSGLPPQPLDPVEAAVANAIAHGTPPSLLCPSPLGPAVAEHTRMRQLLPTAGSARSLQHLLTQRGSGSQARNS